MFLRYTKQILINSIFFDVSIGHSFSSIVVIIIKTERLTLAFTEFSTISGFIIIRNLIFRRFVIYVD